MLKLIVAAASIRSYTVYAITSPLCRVNSGLQRVTDISLSEICAKWSVFLRHGHIYRILRVHVYVHNVHVNLSNEILSLSV